MNELRVVAATALFAMSSYLLYDLVVNGFNWAVLTICLSGYIVLHYIWPRAGAGESHWYDVLELLIDLPYKAIALLLRSVGRLVRSKDAGIDIDL